MPNTDERIARALEDLVKTLQDFLEAKPEDYGRPDKPFGPDSLQSLSEEELYWLEQEDLRRRDLGQLSDDEPIEES